MNQKYASYFNIGINSALLGSGLIFLTLSLINGATHLLLTYGNNGLKETVVPGGIGDE